MKQQLYKVPFLDFKESHKENKREWESKTPIGYSYLIEHIKKKYKWNAREVFGCKRYLGIGGTTYTLFDAITECKKHHTQKATEQMEIVDEL